MKRRGLWLRLDRKWETPLRKQKPWLLFEHVRGLDLVYIFITLNPSNGVLLCVAWIGESLHSFISFFLGHPLIYMYIVKSFPLIFWVSTLKSGYFNQEYYSFVIILYLIIAQWGSYIILVISKKAAVMSMFYIQKCIIFSSVLTKFESSAHL